MSYNVSQSASRPEHKVVRLPPYHCDLNPIEMVWGIAKNHVARNNKTFKLKDTETLVSHALDSIKSSSFKDCIKKTEGIENDYWQRDGLSSAPEYKDFNINIDISSTDTASESDAYESTLFDYSTDTANENEDFI